MFDYVFNEFLVVLPIQSAKVNKLTFEPESLVIAKLSFTIF